MMFSVLLLFVLIIPLTPLSGIGCQISGNSFFSELYATYKALLTAIESGLFLVSSRLLVGVSSFLRKMINDQVPST